MPIDAVAVGMEYDYAREQQPCDTDEMVERLRPMFGGDAAADATAVMRAAEEASGHASAAALRTDVAQQLAADRAYVAAQMNAAATAAQVSAASEAAATLAAIDLGPTNVSMWDDVAPGCSDDVIARYEGLPLLLCAGHGRYLPVDLVCASHLPSVRRHAALPVRPGVRAWWYAIEYHPKTRERARLVWRWLFDPVIPCLP